MDEMIEKMKDLRRAYFAANKLFEQVYAVDETDEEEMKLVKAFNDAVENLEIYYDDKDEELKNEIRYRYESFSE